MTNGINSFDNNDPNIKKLGKTNAAKNSGTPRYVYNKDKIKKPDKIPLQNGLNQSPLQRHLQPEL